MKTRSSLFRYSLILFCAVLPLQALDLKDYLENQKDPMQKVINQAYIHGVGEGFNWVNGGMVSIGRPPLYCQPPKLALTAQNYVDMLDAKIKSQENAATPETHVEPLLLFALMDTFPCAAQKPNK
jgi:hypothetical protein